MLERGLGDLFPLGYGEGWILAGGAGDDYAVGALLLEVRHHVLVHAVVEPQILVAGRAGGDVELAFITGRAGVGFGGA